MPLFESLSRRLLIGIAGFGVFAPLAACSQEPAAVGNPAPVQAVAASAAAAPMRKLDYANDIQPILSNYCYACHGPDTAARKAGLRLDLREKALAYVDKKGIKAIVPGDAEQSELVKRIESHDPKKLMPQDPDKRLDATQIAMLRAWIVQGAEFRNHWAFEKPIKAAIPVVSNAAWCRNEIDRFVMAKLDHENLKPNAEADRSTLIRRVTLDLTGLLPTPAEVDAFVADTSPEAYEKVVDRLLQSDRFGEHRARYWLDYARYGDTTGLHVDAYQSRWPYRDYVIRSFNADKPYDQFTKEQLAGDLLPPENVDHLTATGFIRCGISTGEGGTIIEELRCALKRERTEAFGAVFMGMSTGCAVCHDHKYDPLTQKDFYQLTAFFNNIAEKASCDDRVDWPPNINVPKAENRAAYDAVLVKKAAVQRQIDARRAKANELLAAWIAGGDAAKAVSAEGLTLRLRLDENPRGAADTRLLHNTAPGANPATFTATGPAPRWGEDTCLWPTFRLDTNTRVDLGKAGDFEKDQPFSCGAWIKPRNVANGNYWNTPAGALISKMDNAKAYQGWDIYYTGGPITVQLISAWPANAISMHTEGTTEIRSPFTGPEGSYEGGAGNATLPRGGWEHVFFTYDGSGKAAGLKVYINGVVQKVVVENDTLNGSIRNSVPTWLGRRHDAEPMQATAYQDLRIYKRALTPEEVARLPREDFAAEIIGKKKQAEWTNDERKAIEDHFFTAIDAETKSLTAQIPALDAELVKLATGGDLTLVCREKAGLAYADVLTRGDFNARAERVIADVPHFLPPLPTGAPRNRLGLAQWVLSPENPLTARVAVNRAWQEVFGIGIVETSEDMGIVGERPSNPQLLDWLAVDFIESGWKVKRLYKTLVMSAAYRQSSRATAEVVAKDSKNRLLARGPRFRMEGEMLRDWALQVGGLLVGKIGGPSVKPYQPPGVWEAGAYPGTNTANYAQDHGENLYRRSLYTFWKRMAPMPNLEAFDATDRSNSCVRRQRTNTPLAALVLLNDPQYLEAARKLGVRAVKEGGATAEQRIEFLGRVVLAHPFEASTKNTLLATLERFTAKLGKDEATAKQLLAVGESPVDATVPTPEQAIWMMMATTVMNSDEAINK